MSLPELIIAISIVIFLLLNYILALYGIIYCMRNKKTIVYLLLFIIFYFSIIVGVVGTTRYRMPFMPFINILCVVGFLHFYDKILSQRKQINKLINFKL